MDSLQIAKDVFTALMFFIAAVFTVHGKAADLFAVRFQGVVD